MSKTNILLEAYLFWRNEPVSIKKLSEVLNVSKDEVINEIEILKQKLQDRGIVLLEKDEEVSLGTNVEASALIEKLTKEELSKELSKAALETLSIILYKGPVRRSEIDYIRGVNSQFILRHLEIRGLVEKVQAPDDARAYLYRSTFDLLSHLGISKVSELPEYESLLKAVNEYKDQEENVEKNKMEMESEE